MLTLEELREKPEILREIDWDLAPQGAFEAYQVKSRDSWKHRHLPPVFYFYIDVRKQDAKVFLMRRSLKSAEDVAELPVPPEMTALCLQTQAGERVTFGQYPIDESIRDWIRSQLDR